MVAARRVASCATAGGTGARGRSASAGLGPRQARGVDHVAPAVSFALTDEAEPLCKTDRARVVRIDAGLDSPQSHLLARELEHPLHRLDGQASSRVAFVELIRHLGARRSS